MSTKTDEYTKKIEKEVASIISASEIDEKERERDTIGEKIAFLDYLMIALFGKPMEYSDFVEETPVEV